MIIYAIRETNVDGCGSDATEYVRSSRILNADEQKALQFILEKSKSIASDLDKDWDTSDIIEHALLSFRAAHDIDIFLCSTPIAGEIWF